MAALYGRLQGSRGETTRCGTKASGIRSKLETWEGSIVTYLQADGSFQVTIGPKTDGGRFVVAQGNVNDLTLEGDDLPDRNVTYPYAIVREVQG